MVFIILLDRKQNILIDNATSQPSNSPLGYPKYLCLYTLYFSVHTAPWSNYTIGLMHHAYANDTQVHGPFNNTGPQILSKVFVRSRHPFLDITRSARLMLTKQSL